VNLLFIAASVVSASLLASAAPAEAFWGTGEGDPTYDNLLGLAYAFNGKTQAKIYDSHGWLLMTVDLETGQVAKMKLVDCQISKCIYFRRISDNPWKKVYVEQIDCSEKKFRWRKSTPPRRWGKWFAILGRQGRTVAFNKFCR